MKKLLIAASLLALTADAAVTAAYAAAPPPGQESTEGLDMQAARAKMMTERGKKIAYTKQFDLSGLPHYQPKEKVSGSVRMWGSNYVTDGFLGSYWAAAFNKFQPNVKFDFKMKTTLAAVPSLVFGVSDIGVGRKITFAELELFQRYTDRDPVEIDIATGSFDVPGWNPGFGVVVHKDNPLAHISMHQLDQVFGAERSGGWDGTSWRPQNARGPEQNIRTWGQLGLTGEWANKPIHVYGLNLRYHQATELSDRILAGSDKWNEQMKIYANFVSKTGALERGLSEDLSQDPLGIAIVAAPTTNLSGGAARGNLRMLDLSQKDGGPYIPYTLDTIQNRTYPLYDQIYAYADREPGKKMNPATYEFLRFVLSQEGQAEVIRDGKYLPLTAEAAAAALKKLEEAAK